MTANPNSGVSALDPKAQCTFFVSGNASVVRERATSCKLGIESWALTVVDSLWAASATEYRIYAITYTRVVCVRERESLALVSPLLLLLLLNIASKERTSRVHVGRLLPFKSIFSSE